MLDRLPPTAASAKWFVWWNKSTARLKFARTTKTNKQTKYYSLGTKTDRIVTCRLHDLTPSGQFTQKCLRLRKGQRHPMQRKEEIMCEEREGTASALWVLGPINQCPIVCLFTGTSRISVILYIRYNKCSSQSLAPRQRPSLTVRNSGASMKVDSTISFCRSISHHFLRSSKFRATAVLL